jgi:transcriptional antiterminator RfaH
MDCSPRAVDDEGLRSTCSWWAAINTHPHRENVAAENLVRQNFQIYVPLELKRVRHARRVQDVRRPLFPGYIFARVVPELAMWRPIASTVGVRALVRVGDRPALLDGRFIEALRAREIDGVIAKPASPYEIGQEVRLNGGPLDGIIGRIVEMSDKDRLVLLTDMLQQQVRMRVPAAGVRPL